MDSYKYYVWLTVVLFLGASFLVNSILVVSKYTRRSASEFSTIENNQIAKVKYTIDACIKSGGIVDDVNWNGNFELVNCKENKIK